MSADQPDAHAEVPEVPGRSRSKRTKPRERTPPGRVMSMHAHPDDKTFAVAGTLAKWVRGGSSLNHPDHRAAADVPIDAAFPSAEPRLVFPELLDEGLEPHKVRAVFIHGSDHPDTFIDISEVLDVKLAALKEHRTQMGTWDP